MVTMVRPKSPLRSHLLLVMSVLFVVLMFSSCDRQIASKNPVRSVPDDLPVPVNLSASLGNKTVTLSWQNPTTTGVSRYRAYSSLEQNGTYLLRDSSNTTSVTLAGLPQGQPLFLRVAAVNSSGIEGERSSAKVVTLGPFSVVLNGDDRATRDRNVTAQLTAPATATAVELSEDPNFVGAATQPFSTAKNFALTSGDGSKTVYARFTMSDGATTTGAISDQITLDTRASISALSFSPTGVVFDVGNVITFSLTSGEINGTATVEVVGLGNISLFDDGRAAGDISGDGIYVGTYTVPYNTFVSNALVRGSFRDDAGNEAVQVTAAGFLSIATSPVPVTLASIEPESNFMAHLSWTAAPAENFNSYRLYRRTIQPVTPATGTLVETIADRTSTTFTDTTLVPGTKYYYRVFVFNSSGLSAGSNADSVSAPPNTPPTAVSLAGAFTDSNNVRLTWTPNNDGDFATYQIYRRTTPGVTTSDQLVTIINARGTDNYSDFVNANTVYYKIFVFDRHGLSTGSNEVTVITQ